MNSIRIVLLFTAFLFMKYSMAQTNDFQLMEGDLLFQDLDCGKYCDAIDKVTYGVNNVNFNHVGILLKNEQGNWMVLEAVSEGVKKSPLATFLNKNLDKKGEPKVVVGRLKADYQYIIEKVIKNGDSYLGKHYDQVYDIDDDTYYCSELVYYLYRDKNEDPIFQLYPMTFKDPDTNEFFPAWIAYFNELGVTIPEGKPGLNPGGISRSDKLEIYFPYSDFNEKEHIE